MLRICDSLTWSREVTVSMEIRYETGITDVCWQRVAALIEAVGWPRRPAKALRKAFSNSSCVRLAYHQDKIIGFGRTADDGMYYGMVVDLVVDPEYQRRGIGSEILRQLREEMDNQGFYIMTLVAAPGKEEFYLKQGWIHSKTSFHWSRKRSRAPCSRD